MKEKYLTVSVEQHIYRYITESMGGDVVKLERDRNEIRFKDYTGKYVYGFYIEQNPQTKEEAPVREDPF